MRASALCSSQQRARGGSSSILTSAVRRVLRFATPLSDMTKPTRTPGLDLFDSRLFEEVIGLRAECPENSAGGPVSMLAELALQTYPQPSQHEPSEEMDEELDMAVQRHHPKKLRIFQ